MTELQIIAKEMVDMEIVNKLGSDVCGRRNWAIRIETRPDNSKIAFVGGFGQMKRCGFMSEYLNYIAKYHVRWFEFTYKKSFEKTLAILEKAGFKIFS